MDTKRKFMSVREAAEALGVSPVTLYRAIWSGRISKGIIRTPGGHYLIDLGELLEELKNYAELYRERRRRKKLEGREGGGDHGAETKV